MARMKVTAPVRAKATSSDIFARLAKGECANFHNGGCQSGLPCTVMTGENCDYFDQYVKPLLEYPEFSGKYSREAKITVALNPRAKVVRKRRQNAEPALTLDAPQAAPPVKQPRASTPDAPKARATRKRGDDAPRLELETANGKRRRKADVPVAPPAPAVIKAGRPKKTVTTMTAAVPAATTAPARATRKIASPSTKAKATPRRKEDAAITTVVSVTGQVRETPRVDREPKKNTGKRQPRTVISEPVPQLLLELTPDQPRKAARRR